jgi:hypothetical protein
MELPNLRVPLFFRSWPFSARREHRHPQDPARFIPDLIQVRI